VTDGHPLKIIPKENVVTISILLDTQGNDFRTTPFMKIFIF